MPRYELSLITKALKNVSMWKIIQVFFLFCFFHCQFFPLKIQGALADVLRRTAILVMENGGVVRKMENLGEQELPYKIRAHNEWHTHGRSDSYHWFGHYLTIALP